jgi:two-component system, OmpR family, sensor histidine kinase KdpD
VRSGVMLKNGWRGLACAAALPPLAAVGLLPMRGSLNLVSHALVLLLTVVGSAMLGGFLCGLLAAVWATALLNFMFTPPFHTYRVTDPNNVVALLVFALVAAVVGWAVDQSVRRRDEALRAATAEAADRVRAALLAAVGHDLRTPLAGVKAGISGLLSEDVELSREDRQELLEGADASVDRLAALVENLLDLSRVQAGTMPVRVQPIAVDEVVAQALEEVAASPTPVIVDIPDDLPDVAVDPGLLERVLANLIGNAARFSPPDTPLHVSGRVRDGRVELLVIDRGPGIPTSDHDAVFRPFQRLGDTTNTEGLGLGLALARGLADAMDADLVPTETEGGGLTMVVSLKVAR